MATPLFAGPVRFLGSFTDSLPAPTLPEVAFAGRSNVGKSSAINVLLGHAGVARVSKTPGRTQALNLFDIGGRWIVVDLPGYGFAKVSHKMRGEWKALIENYLGERLTLKLVVCLVDGRLPAQEKDRVLIDGLRDAGLPFLLLATKIDGLVRGKRDAAVAALARGHDVPVDGIIPFSSVEDIGREDARRTIAQVITSAANDP